jgi:hypothetical protein
MKKGLYIGCDSAALVASSTEFSATLARIVLPESLPFNGEAVLLKDRDHPSIFITI